MHDIVCERRAGEVLSQRESLFSQTGATPSKKAMATSLAAPAPLGPAAAPVPAARRGGEASVAPRAVEADTRPSSASGGTSSQDGPATPDGASAAAEGQLPGRKRMRQGSPIASLQSEDHEGGSRFVIVCLMPVLWRHCLSKTRVLHACQPRQYSTLTGDTSSVSDH